MSSSVQVSPLNLTPQNNEKQYKDGEGGEEEEEEEQRGVPEWAEQLALNVVCLPAKAYAAKAHGAALAGLKAALEAKWARDEEGAWPA